MNQEDIQLLEKDGWVVTCESPFEIEQYDDEIEGLVVGTATGNAAQYVLDLLRKFVEEVQYDFNSGAEESDP